jgi:hypothetical protein
MQEKAGGALDANDDNAREGEPVRRQTALLLAAMIYAISLCLTTPALARPSPGVNLGIHLAAPPP